VAQLKIPCAVENCGPYSPAQSAFIGVSYHTRDLCLGKEISEPKIVVRDGLVD